MIRQEPQEQATPSRAAINSQQAFLAHQHRAEASLLAGRHDCSPVKVSLNYLFKDPSLQGLMAKLSPHENNTCIYIYIYKCISVHSTSKEMQDSWLDICGPMLRLRCSSQIRIVQKCLFKASRLHTSEYGKWNMFSFLKKTGTSNFFQSVFF